MSELAAVLRHQRDQIVARFVAEVRWDAIAPPDTAPPLLVDHIPAFLDEIVAALTPSDTENATVPAAAHGIQRWTLGYDLEALIREYGVLRRQILAVAKEHGVRMSLDEMDVLGQCFDIGVGVAAAAYAKHRDEHVALQRSNVEFLAEAGQLLTSSLDYRSTLSRLMGLLVPRMADWCAVHLEPKGVESVAVAHVDPVKADLVREIYQRFPLPADSDYGFPSVARTGEAQLMSEIPPDFLERVAVSKDHLALLRAVGSRSWLVVPLRVQGNMFGAMTLVYSDSDRRYSEADLLLASELARRAAVAIDNARLYDLSQKERARAEAGLRAKDEFVAMVSHELRTPLNAVLGWLRLMRTTTLGPEKAQHGFEVIERNAEALSQLVSDLLDISRIISGRLRIHPSQVDLANVLEMAIEGVRPAADAKRITLASDLGGTEATLRGDGDRLQQVIWNLLSNAVKFTPKGGTVRIRLRRVESDLELEVADDGVGIDPAFLPHVFESFRQYDGSITRDHGGLGLGLSIAKHIVELHGGSIVASSEGKGRGASFLVRLPISPVVSLTPGIARVPATTRELGPSLPVGLDGVRVLVVDDDPDARDLIVQLFETCNIDVRAVGTAADALSELERFGPHVVLSDVGMPNEDGYFLIRKIRSHPDEALRTVPVVALTAFASNDDRTRALVEGFNLHVAKPVEPAALVRSVADLARART